MKLYCITWAVGLLFVSFDGCLRKEVEEEPFTVNADSVAYKMQRQALDYATFELRHSIRMDAIEARSLGVILDGIEIRQKRDSLTHPVTLR